jgi:hypothetical protein
MLRRGRNQGLIKKLFMAMGVLIVMLIVVLIVIVTGGNGGQQSAEVLDSWKFVKGVSVGGIDVSGMTVEQASKPKRRSTLLAYTGSYRIIRWNLWDEADQAVPQER